LARDQKFVLAYDELQTIFRPKAPTQAEIFGVDKDGQPNLAFERDIVLYKCYRASLVDAIDDAVTEVNKMLKSREEAKSLREMLSFSKKEEKDPLLDYLLSFKDRMGNAKNLLTDDALTAFFFVTLPESL
jgi:hypothetical protein